jgi:hypothetical protein
MDEKTGKIAMFRYGLIVPLVAEALPKGELTRRAEEIATRRYDIPASKRTAISVDTLLRWVMRYRKGGLGSSTTGPRAIARHQSPAGRIDRPTEEAEPSPEWS